MERQVTSDLSGLLQQLKERRFRELVVDEDGFWKIEDANPVVAALVEVAEAAEANRYKAKHGTNIAFIDSGRALDAALARLRQVLAEGQPGFGVP